MAGNFKKDDVRVRKTNAALINSMFVLLNAQNFGNISVNVLCEEAMISRATFYAHFVDKYELMRSFMTSIIKDISSDFYACNESNIITFVNEFIMANKKIIKNTIEDANETTMELLQEFIMQFTCIIFGYENKNDARANTDSMMLQKFYAGGVIDLLKWQIKNKFPADAQFMTEDLCDVAQYILQRNYSAS